MAFESHAQIKSTGWTTTTNATTARGALELLDDDYANLSPRTPPLAFNSWFSYGTNVSAAKMMSVATAMATNGLRAAGWRWIVLDDGWCTSRDTNGVMVADPTRFPGGLIQVADDLHALGFLFGAYTDYAPSGHTSGGFVGTPTNGNFVETDMAFFASNRVDWITYDGAAQFRSVGIRAANAIQKSGRKMMLQSAADQYNPWQSEVLTYVRPWTGVIGDVHSFSVFRDWTLRSLPFVGAVRPGFYLDIEGDFSVDLSPPETIFIVQSMLSSPSVLNQTNLNGAALKLATNSQLLAISQDPAVIAATPVVTNNNLHVWTKPLGGASSPNIAVALINWNDTGPSNITAFWTNVYLAEIPNPVCAVFDCVRKTIVNWATNSYTASVATHGAKLYKLLPGRRTQYKIGTNWLGTDYLPWISATSDVSYCSNPEPSYNAICGITTMVLNGTNYPNGIAFYAATNNPGLITYWLGGQVSEFTATLAEDASVVASSRFLIYGDDTLLFTSATLTQSQSTNVTFAVGSYDKLTIRAETAFPSANPEVLNGFFRCDFQSVPTPSGRDSVAIFSAPTNVFRSIKIATASGGSFVIETNGAGTLINSVGTTNFAWDTAGKLTLNGSGSFWEFAPTPTASLNFKYNGTSIGAFNQNFFDVNVPILFGFPGVGDTAIARMSGGGLLEVNNTTNGVLRDIRARTFYFTTNSPGVFDTSGTGTPEGVLAANIGSTFHRIDGGAGTSFYVKESGTNNTGWIAK